MSWIYGVKLSRDADRGDLVVSVRDLPDVLTSGFSEADALAMAGDAIDTLVSHMMERGEALCLPSPVRRGEHPVCLPLQTAGKATLYRLWRESGISKSEFARRLGVRETEARRILDPRHGTRLPALEAAARALGHRLDIVSSKAG